MSDNDLERALTGYRMALRRLLVLTDGFKHHVPPAQRLAWERFMRGDQAEPSCDTAIARFMKRQPALLPDLHLAFR